MFGTTSVPLDNTCGPRRQNLNVQRISVDQQAESISGEVDTMQSSSTDTAGSKDFETKFQTLRLQLATLAISLALLAFVITYVQATYAAEHSSQQGLQLNSLLKTNASTILTILRASQGLLSMLTALALDGAFVLLHCNSMVLQQGLPYLTLLSLSPSTNAWGLLGIMRSSTPPIPTRLLAALRLTLPAVVWFSGLVLFFNTSSVTVYDMAMSYPVTAGVGRFNGSLVEPFRTLLHSLQPEYPYETIPYNYLASAYTLVVNPLIATVAEPRRCTAEPCISYLLSGGLTSVTPLVPRDHVDYSLVRVKHAPTIQADFSGPLMNGVSFSDSDCDVFGQEGTLIGIRLCVRVSPARPGVLTAGMFVCPEGIANGACSANTPAPNMTIQVSFHSLQASFVSSRKNYTIVSIVDTTEATPILDLDLPAYRDALRWLLNYTDANLPPPTSIAQSFWSSQGLLEDPSAWGILAQNFQSILVFPFWLFNANNWGNTQIQLNATISTMPPEFYTEASLVEPYTKLRVDKGMFALFLTLQIVALLFVAGVVVWVWLRKRPARKASSFPLFDILFRAELLSPEVWRCPANISDSKIISGLKETKVKAT
ncbi:hypothetical protein PGQ11_012699 [Apiospora arundinis]|uniref:Uncharacterized protein n=1 Tax=Apiospora arundinis TaxID=335852 RepID=A0ABR2I444_9PEZI